MRKPLCALTMGDPSGIGPEIILKTIFSRRANRAADIVVVGYPEPFERDAVMLGMDISIHRVRSPRDLPGKPDTLPLVVPEHRMRIPPGYGVVDPKCGEAAARCIEYAAHLALDGEVDAIVTAPINKESLNLAGYAFAGHTEFLQHLTRAKDIAMLLTLGEFRVIHVVTHTPIRDVPGMIRQERIVRVAVLMEEALRLTGIEKPRLAVCGLNPHAGEAGMFGREEIEEIAPAVAILRERGITVTGPISPDTVFARGYSGEFDGIVAMYHDQGHIALKLAGFRFGGEHREVGGVNTTLGLPIIRTSVDHGTAFDIAGKAVASNLSLIEAVEMAALMAAGRTRAAK